MVFVFCLVQGDAIKNSFLIDIKRDNNIAHVKEAIIVKIPNALEGIDVNSLTLWKVDIVQTKENQGLIINEHAVINEHTGVELYSFENVGNVFENVFQETPSSNIRIIVKPSRKTTGNTNGK
jgi:hypothetical protein